jgi:sec-independent protein translocase protein TatB
MGFGETIFLFMLALVIFGPKKLPEIARQVGRMLNEVKRASNEFKSQIEQEVNNLEREESRKILPLSAPPEGAIASRSLNGAFENAAPAPVISSEPAEDPPLNAALSDPPAASTDPAPGPGQESHG